MEDPRTPAERAYDELKSGQVYVKPQPAGDQEYGQLLDSVWSRVTSILADADPAPNLPQYIKDWIDRHLEEEARAAEFAAGLRDGIALGKAIKAMQEDAAIDAPADASVLSVLEILALPDDHPINVAANARMEALIAAEIAELAATDADEEDDEEEEDDAESVPVPPVPAGYPTDKALLNKWYGDTFITIDRRDGEMAICTKGEMGGTILTPAFAAALYQFFWNDAIIELMEYHRKKADPNEQPTPPVIVGILEKIEAHFEKQPAA